MRGYGFLLIFVFAAFIFPESNMAQNVCIGIRGTAPAILTASAKKVKACRNNPATAESLYKIPLTMNSCGTIPASSVSYQWKNISTGMIPPAGASVIAQDTGKWVATVKNTTTLIEYTDTVYIAFYPEIYINVVSDELSFLPSIRYCPLTTLTLIATTDLPPPNTFQWIALTDPAPEVVAGATGAVFKFKRKFLQYAVVVKDDHGCAASDTSNFFPLDTYFNAELGPDKLTGYCEGNTVNLATSVPPVAKAYPYYTTYYGYKKCEDSDCNGNGDVVELGSTMTYTTPLLFQEQFAPIPVTLAPGLNKYYVRLSGGISCDGTDSVLIYSRPKPVVNIGPDTLVCYDADKTISAKISSGKPPYKYTWSPGTFPNKNTITVSSTADITYTVVVEDANSDCGVGTDSKLLTVNPAIDVTVSSDDTICRYPPGMAYLSATASGGTGVLSYEWSPNGPNDGLSDGSILNPTAVPTTYPNFTPSKTIFTFLATDEQNCSAKKIVTVNYFVPSLASIPDPVVVSESSPQDLNVSNGDNGGYSFSWTTSVSSSVISTSPILSLSYNGPDTIYYVITAHSNSNGALNSCMNHDTIEVRYISDNILLYVPNVFSPNAVSEENRTLKVYGDNLFEEGFKFIIFNRWGNVMYESTDLSEVQTKGWDGGSLIEGVYTYVIVGKFKNGKDVKESPYYKGSFTLMK